MFGPPHFLSNALLHSCIFTHLRLSLTFIALPTFIQSENVLYRIFISIMLYVFAMRQLFTTRFIFFFCAWQCSSGNERAKRSERKIFSFEIDSLIWVTYSHYTLLQCIIVTKNCNVSMKSAAIEKYYNFWQQHNNIKIAWFIGLKAFIISNRLWLQTLQNLKKSSISYIHMYFILTLLIIIITAIQSMVFGRKPSVGHYRLSKNAA